MPRAARSPATSSATPHTSSAWRPSDLANASRRRWPAERPLTAGRRAAAFRLAGGRPEGAGRRLAGARFVVVTVTTTVTAASPAPEELPVLVHASILVVG